MSKLAQIEHLLAHYRALKYHQNPQLAQRLQEVQQWQRQRMQHTHEALFAKKENQLMAQYFLQRLYGGRDFDALAEQIQRITHYAHKVESIIPEHAIHTGITGIRLAILAVQLDEQVAQRLLLDYAPDIPLTDDMMQKTYLKLEQNTLRLRQLQLLEELGRYWDQHMRSFVLYTAFKMCKGLAYGNQLQLMYDFIQEGFLAIKPMKSAAKFVQEFTATERQIITKVHSDHPTPFRV